MEKVTEKIDIAIEKINKIGGWLYKKRFYIAIIFFILCVIFEISGSSIEQWKTFGMSDVENGGVILGKSRSIRSDEWAVLTPMTFSQKFEGFKYFSNIIRADKTDIFIVYGLPTLNLMQVFRPFQIGFLFLGLAKGLAFFWYGRAIVLFLVMMELFMLITKKNKLLSFVSAVMITLAPMVQWWFAVNGIAEIFIFGGLAVILLNKYMNTENLKTRCLYLLGMVICAGGYIMVFYPAWQIPMFYVFLILAIWVIVENRKNCKINYKDIISIIVALVIFACCMGYIFSQSMDTIKAVLNTVYPGARAELGGDGISKLVEYPMNIFLPFKDTVLGSNPCEKALMFGLFPIGMILAIITLVKNEKKDLLLILSFIVYAILTAWAVIGFPEILSKLTFLSKTKTTRIFLAIGVLDIIILMRSLTIIKQTLKNKIALVVSALLTILIVVLCERHNKIYIDLKMSIAMAIMCFYLYYFLLSYKQKYSKYLFAGGITFVMLMSGLTVNPITKGVDVIYESTIIKEVQRINSQESGKWITETLGFPISNYILMAGVPVVNTTNVYPDMERWHSLDKDNKYEEVYNRYAHIQVNLRKDDSKYEEKFVLTSADCFTVYLLPKELKELDIKYIFTERNNLEKYNTEEIKFEKVENSIKGYYIYKMNS